MRHIGSTGYGNTFRRVEDDGTVVWTLHDTDIVTISPRDEHGGRKVVFDTGGWFTPTTKRRMNQAMADENISIRVFQEKHGWFARANHIGGHNEWRFDGNTCVMWV